MWGNLMLNLLLAHFVGDFVFQSDVLSRDKKANNFTSWFLYVHTFVIAILSWAAIGYLDLWPLALVIGATHLLIDGIKSCVKKDSLCLFVSDQILHIVILIVVANICVDCCGWASPGWMTDQALKAVAVANAAIFCWKPANILIKYILQYCKMVVPEDDTTLFHAGKLIGTLERWLILTFLLIGRYEVIGFLITAKSIIRFGDKDKSIDGKQTYKDQTEYFLAGTLLSISFAVACGLLLRIIV